MERNDQVFSPSISPHNARFLAYHPTHIPSINKEARLIKYLLASLNCTHCVVWFFLATVCSWKPSLLLQHTSFGLAPPLLPPQRLSLFLSLGLKREAGGRRWKSNKKEEERRKKEEGGGKKAISLLEASQGQESREGKEGLTHPSDNKHGGHLMK